MDYLSKHAFPSSVLMLQRKGIYVTGSIIYVSDTGNFDTKLYLNIPFFLPVSILLASET